MAQVQLNVRMDEADAERIRAVANERGLSLGRLVRDAVLGTAAPVASVLDRLEALEAQTEPDWVERVNVGITNLAGRLRALEGSHDHEAIHGLDRRLTELEERARASYR